MKEVLIHSNLTTTIHDIPIPTPAHDEVVIQVVVAGCNPKDWMRAVSAKAPFNSGDDIAGFVHSLGKAVEASGEFRIGDRVAAFHRMLTPGGAYAEYAVAPAQTTFIIPAALSFEEAATIPLVALTAAISLFQRQGLPLPWSPLPSTAEAVPLIIYGASSALGTFAVKLAKSAGVHPIIAVCGSSKAYVSGLLDPMRGDAVVDYRQSPEAMIQEVRTKLGPLTARHALDAISADGSWLPLTQLVSPKGGQVSVVSGSNAYDEAVIPAGVQLIYTFVGTAHSGDYLPSMPKQPIENKEAIRSDVEFAYLMMRYIGRMLNHGRFEGHPYEVIPGGLNGVQTGLQRLSKGQAKGLKFVYRISETDAK